MIQIKDNEIYSDKGRLVHRIGTDDYFRHSTALPSDTADEFEEVDELPSYTEEEYKAKVRSLIAMRYTIEDELAIQRQKDAKPVQYAEYDAFCEDCKLRAKEALLNKDAGL